MNDFFKTMMLILIVILLILLIAASLSLLIIFHFKDDKKKKFNKLIEEPIISVCVNPTNQIMENGHRIRDRRSLESFCWIPTEFKGNFPSSTKLSESNYPKHSTLANTYFNPIFGNSISKSKTSVYLV